MSQLTFTDMLDLVKATLPDLGRLKFSMIATELQDYEVMPRWLKKDKVILESGISIQRTLMNEISGTAEHRSWFSENNTNITDHIKQLDVPWRYVDDSWALGYHEGLVNRGKALIFKVAAPRRIGCMLNMAAELELKAWSSPPASSDKVQPYGVPYYVVKNATDGFNGGAPTGHTAVAGLNPETIDNWKNYTFTYGAVSKGGLIKKMRRAHRQIRFKSPVKYPGYAGDASDRYRIYVNNDTIEQIEEVGEAQNENLGRDIASMDGTMVFKKNPIVWIPQLDDDTTNPIYMIAHDYFRPYVLKGDYLREDGPHRHPFQRNVMENFVSLSYNYVCLNRRAQAVGYYVAP